MDFSALKKNINFLLFHVLAPIVCAACIYLFCRTKETVVFKLASLLIGSGSLDGIRVGIHSLQLIPSFVVYSLPGGLWVYAFSNFFLLSIKSSIKKYYHASLIVFFSIVVGLEILQLLTITDGTFDLLDVFAYLLAILGSYLMGKNKGMQFKQRFYFPSKHYPAYLLTILIVLFVGGIYLADVFVK